MRFLDNPPRHLFFTGKGGVGKTSIACASAVVLLQFFVMRPLAALDLPWQVYGLSAAMAILSTVLPTFMLSAAIRRLGSDQASLIGSVGPVATILFGWWLLGESVSALQLAGAALVLAGVLLASRRTSAT